MLSIMPAFKLSHLSRNMINNMCKHIQNARKHNWKRYVVSNVPHNFNPHNDMNGNELFGNAKTTVFGESSECRKITLKIPSANNEVRTIVVFIVWYPGSVYPDIDAMMRQIVAWFVFVVRFARSNCGCSEHVNLYLLLTEHEATLPDYGTKLELDNMLSAYTFTCKKHNDILVLKQNVWFKAVIHESFHTFGLDFGDINHDSTELLAMFPGVSKQIDVRLSEAYTDIWATICYVLMNTNLSIRERTTRNHLVERTARKNMASHSVRYTNNRAIQRIEYELHRQSCFALLQCAKFMIHHNITPKSLFSGRGVQHSETDMVVFNYHVIRSIYMSDMNSFIEWTLRHNDTNEYLRFRPENIQSFIHLISVILGKKVWNIEKAINVAKTINKEHKLYRTAVLTYPLLEFSID